MANPWYKKSDKEPKGECVPVFVKAVVKDKPIKAEWVIKDGKGGFYIDFDHKLLILGMSYWRHR